MWDRLLGFSCASFVYVSSTLRTWSINYPEFALYFLQNGVTTSVKPQQVTFIVPGIQNFDHTEISNFLQGAQDNLVCYSWTFELTGSSLQIY